MMNSGPIISIIKYMVVMIGTDFGEKKHRRPAKYMCIFFSVRILIFCLSKLPYFGLILEFNASEEMQRNGYKFSECINQ